MRRPWQIAIALAVVAAITFGIWHHVTGPRLELEVQPRAVLTEPECRAEVGSRGYGSSQASTYCKPAGSWASYEATVTNTGGRGAWVSTCAVDPLDASGAPIRGFEGVSVPMWMTSPGVGARPYLSPGASATFDWFVKDLPPGQVRDYDGTCAFVVYDTPPI